MNNFYILTICVAVLLMETCSGRYLGLDEDVVDTEDSEPLSLREFALQVIFRQKTTTFVSRPLKLNKLVRS